VVVSPRRARSTRRPLRQRSHGLSPSRCLGHPSGHSHFFSNSLKNSSVGMLLIVVSRGPKARSSAGPIVFGTLENCRSFTPTPRRFRSASPEAGHGRNASALDPGGRKPLEGFYTSSNAMEKQKGFPGERAGPHIQMCGPASPRCVVHQPGSRAGGNTDLGRQLPLTGGGALFGRLWHPVRFLRTNTTPLARKKGERMP
jgi:hypothetical protein